MKYIFIIYLFDVLDVNILLYKFGQTQTNFSQGKAKCLIFQDGGSRPASDGRRQQTCFAGRATDR